MIDLRHYADPTRIPTLVLLDLQQEYLASPRVLALPDAEAAIESCRSALHHARAMGFPIVFARWRARSPLFNPATRFAKWIEGFEPHGTELVFERDRPSLYASGAFTEVMNHGDGSFVLAGFAGESACLSTVIDAFHRGHRVTFLNDASASHGLEDIGPAEVHRTVSRLVGLYGESISTRMWIERTARPRRVVGERP
ncbi:Isochorismatase family protein [Blastochloris viridis]|uniref:Isochorismatase family protein n=1 Tax=Blastochloris viridis TaxID=1079 RepID=A0A0S4Q1H3_BLAVI|nr:Isochorismatase family protein [Blastochloris viridis]